MLNAEQSIVDEVEQAVSLGSPEKSLDTIRQVTELFLASAGSFNSEQIELFDVVLERLIRTIELRAIADVSARIALAETSLQLAGIAQAPPTVIRRLARHDEITVAGPVLTESARLSAEDLVEIAETKSEQHLLAISGRWWLSEIVTDALLARHYPAVSRRLIKNPGARVSASGFAIVVAQAESDPELAVDTGIRVDLPSELRQQLLRSATDAVKDRLLSRAPPHMFEEIRNTIAKVSASVDREMAVPRDFTAARQFVAQLKTDGKLNEATLFAFARSRKYEETVAALAVLSEIIDRGDPSVDAEPARRRPAGSVQGRTIELGDHQRHPGVPLFDGIDGAARIGEGQDPVRKNSARQRAAFAEVLAGSRHAADQAELKRQRAVQTVNRPPSFPLIATVRTAPGASPLMATGMKCSVRPCVGLSIKTLR